MKQTKFVLIGKNWQLVKPCGEQPQLCKNTLFVKIAYFVNLCSVCDASNLGKERYYNLGQKKKKKKELGTPSTKVIVCKSCGELQCLSCQTRVLNRWS